MNHKNVACVGYVCSRERLSASDMLQVRKVIEHVYEKVLGQSSDDGSQSAQNDGARTDVDPEDLATAALERVAIYCNDQVGSAKWVSAGERTLTLAVFARRVVGECHRTRRIIDNTYSCKIGPILLDEHEDSFQVQFERFGYKLVGHRGLATLVLMPV